MSESTHSVFRFQSMAQSRVNSQAVGWGGAETADGRTPNEHVVRLLNRTNQCYAEWTLSTEDLLEVKALRWKIADGDSHRVVFTKPATLKVGDDTHDVAALGMMCARGTVGLQLADATGRPVWEGGAVAVEMIGLLDNTHSLIEQDSAMTANQRAAYAHLAEDEDEFDDDSMLPAHWVDQQLRQQEGRATARRRSMNAGEQSSGSMVGGYDLNVRLRGVRSYWGNTLVQAETVGLDMDGWPVTLTLKGTVNGERRSFSRSFDAGDLNAMRKNLQFQIWPLSRDQSVSIEIPVTERPKVLEMFCRAVLDNQPGFGPTSADRRAPVRKPTHESLHLGEQPSATKMVSTRAAAIRKSITSAVKTHELTTFQL